MNRSQQPARVAYFLVLGALCTGQAHAGAYSRVATCSQEAGCFHGVPKSAPGNNVNPFGITHPLVFDRGGGDQTLRVCVDPASGLLLGPARRAAEMWNGLQATTENCMPRDRLDTSLAREGCATWEETPPPERAFFAESILLHELGHCALGLDHPDRPVDIADDGFFESTSFSRSWGEALIVGSIVPGADGIRGSYDDSHLAPFGQIAENVSWFRKFDNNPFIVDGTTIDSATFARSITQSLPAGHSWAANGNRVVGESLGFAETQSVMYSRITDHMRYRGLSADDVNMLKMAQSGEDRLAGTADDYTVTLQILDSCDGTEHVVVGFVALGAGVAGICENADIDYAFTPPNVLTAIHFKIVPFSAGSPLLVSLNSDLNWELGPATAIATDSMEGGDTSGWSAAYP